MLYHWGIKIHLSPSSLLWMFIWPVGQGKKKENWVPDKRCVFLLGNKPEMFWLNKKAVVKAMPPLHEKGPFPSHSFPELSLAEAGPEASNAFRPARQHGQDHGSTAEHCGTCLESNSVLVSSSVFYFLTQLPVGLKNALPRLSKNRLQCHAPSYAAWAIPALLNLSRNVILRKAWGETVSQAERWLTVTWNREQKDCHLQLEISRESIVSEFFCK